jgi:hypothetical protein
VGGFLATPYALFYDLPAVTFAIVLVIAEVARRRGAWSLAEVLVLLFAYVAPYAQFLVALLPVPVSALALILLFAIIVRRALTSSPSAEPVEI